MKYLDWLETNPQKGYYWVRLYDCDEERIDEFTDWYDNAGNVETKFTEQPDEVISGRLTFKPDKQEEHGVSSNNPAWEKLFEMLDTNHFTCADMAACICATLCRYKDPVFETELMCGGYNWNVKIERK